MFINYFILTNQNYAQIKGVFSLLDLCQCIFDKAEDYFRHYFLFSTNLMKLQLLYAITYL